MIKRLLRAFVKKCFPDYYEELLQDEHEQFLIDNGIEKTSLSFNVLKDREAYKRYIETVVETNKLVNTTKEV